MKVFAPQESRWWETAQQDPAWEDFVRFVGGIDNAIVTPQGWCWFREGWRLSSQASRRQQPSG